jgi:uncharacterized membrane protein YdbT with pleckstrin-like domain
MGNYVQDNLNKGEKLVYETSLHWIIFMSLRSLLTLFIAPAIEMSTSEFALTNKRLIIKIGLISRRTLEINLQRLESINIDQGVFGRMMGYGTVIVIGTGGTRMVYDNVANPAEFRRQYQMLTAS